MIKMMIIKIINDILIMKNSKIINSIKNLRIRNEKMKKIEDYNINK